MSKKVCSRCSLEKPHSMFSKDKYKSDGLKSSCKSCVSLFRKSRAGCLKSKSHWESYYKENREDILQRQASDHNRKESARLRYKDKRDNIRLYQSEYSQLPASKASKAKRESFRRSRKFEATPTWLTQDHMSQIKEIYWLCKDVSLTTGEPYHVDHIIPLKGTNVCGLHVPWNLQILPADINLAKSNNTGAIT